MPISNLTRFCWILILSLIIILSVKFQINQKNENPERTGALLDSRDIELVSKNFINTHVLYVISLDGKITAIDVREKGRQLWIVNTGTPLVNSTLSKIEISRNSKSIRLIPSLIGGFYEKSDEDEYMQTLPFDAESLLNTSSHFHDELIMTGGKDIDTLGLDLNTGKVIYSFSNDNIDQKTLNSTCSASMLIIKRTKQTVRAQNVQNGYEKWIFSVSNHELIHLYTPTSDEVLEEIEQPNKIFFEYRLQTGVVLAFDHDNQLIWTSVINSPIAAVWELKNGQLKEKSLFKTRLSHRLAFMGEFNSTPYVIISSRIQRQLISNARKIAGSKNKKGPRLSSWYKANQKRLLTMNSELPENDQKNSLVIRQNEPRDIVGYLELIDSDKNILDEGKDELSENVNSQSTWTMSSICLGGLIIILIWYSKRKEVKLQHQESIISETSSDYQLSEPLFQSRYFLEYEHVRFLGRGGFGVVFEAINKLDERRVAIKRVSLKKLSGKERALKEIRCLAVLNHPNLIQYYYAWNECPPTGWQDEEDEKLIIRNNEKTRDSLSTFPTSVVSDYNNESSHPAKHPSTSCLSPLIDFTFERSLNPPQVDEDSNSSLFEHSYDSSDEDISNQTKSLIEQENSDCVKTYFYFVMELCQSESLRDRLIKKTIHQTQVWSIIDEIIKGIEYIHSQKLIHRDLKPSNILFSLDNTVKIGDFGLVSAFGEDKIEKIDQAGNNELGGTILYMSPEQINRQSYNEKVDIYAIGIILFELLFPFSTQMERIRALTNVRLETSIFPIDFQCNELICRLIRWLLSYSPHDRPKACELRQDNSYQNMFNSENLFC